jgi:hypothetical protein
LPEIARRLGDPHFTRQLTLSEEAISDFVNKPEMFLCDVLENLDGSSKAAIGIVFMRGGRLKSPVEIAEEERSIIQMFGGNPASVKRALPSLDGSLLILRYEGGSRLWAFRHPTIHDAFSSVIAKNPELLELYLKGTRLERVVTEITCGRTDLPGARIIVPQHFYALIIDRFTNVIGFNARKLYLFLTFRCDCEFLRQFAIRHKRVIEKLQFRGGLLADSLEANLIARLFECKVLPETVRVRFVETVLDKHLKHTLDDGFLLYNIRKLFRPSELSCALDRARHLLLLNRLEDEIREEADRYRENPEGDPDDYFMDIKQKIWNFADEFAVADDTQRAMDEAFGEVERQVKVLEQFEPIPGEPSEDDFTDDFVSSDETGRLIFDDVDQ